MALQGSGAISLANIQTEFGGSNPISLSEYYRGGAYVGSSNTNVPTSGLIRMSNFYGASAYDPYPADFPSLYMSGSDYFSGYANYTEADFTITGINTPVTLRFNVSPGLSPGNFNTNYTFSYSAYVISGGGTGGGVSWNQTTTPVTKTFNIVVNNGTVIRLQGSLSVFQFDNQGTQGASASAAGDVTLDNLTTGQNGLAYGSLNFDASTGGGLGGGLG